MVAPCFEELDCQQTPVGELVLRRRRSPAVSEMVYEVKLNDEMLMSSSVTAGENALATLALEPRKDRPLEVLIGGLGLGCTAAAALRYPNVRRVVVVELLAPVIRWHRHRLVPLAETLMSDPRCCLVQGDFFEQAAESAPACRYDAVLLDIDHAPDCLLHADHGRFYASDRLTRLAAGLRPQGVFAIWSAWKPEPAFFETLATVFSAVEAHEVAFWNPHVNETLSNWIVTAEK